MTVIAPRVAHPHTANAAFKCRNPLDASASSLSASWLEMETARAISLIFGVNALDHDGAMVVHVAQRANDFRPGVFGASDMSGLGSTWSSGF